MKSTVLFYLLIVSAQSIFIQDTLSAQSKVITQKDCQTCDNSLAQYLKTENITFSESETIEWLKQYFESSEKVRSEMKKSGSMSLGIGAIIESIPVKLESNKNSSENDKYWFTKYTTWTNEHYISLHDIYYAYKSAIPEVAWDAWLKCKKEICGRDYTGVELIVEQIRPGSFDIRLWNFSDNDIKIKEINYDILVPNGSSTLKPNVKISAFKGSASNQANTKDQLDHPFKVSVDFLKLNKSKTVQTESASWDPLPPTKTILPEAPSCPAFEVYDIELNVSSERKSKYINVSKSDEVQSIQVKASGDTEAVTIPFAINTNLSSSKVVILNCFYTSKTGRLRDFQFKGATINGKGNLVANCYLIVGKKIMTGNVTILYKPINP